MSAKNRAGITSATHGTRWVPTDPVVHKEVVLPVRLSVKCAKRRCGGEMVAKNSITLGMGPTMTRHECNRCAAEAVYLESYPVIAFQNVALDSVPEAK